MKSLLLECQSLLSDVEDPLDLSDQRPVRTILIGLKGKVRMNCKVSLPDLFRRNRQKFSSVKRVPKEEKLKGVDR